MTDLTSAIGSLRFAVCIGGRSLVTGIWTLAICGCAGWLDLAGPTGSSGTGASVVREFCRRFGTRGTRQVVGLFAADAVFEIDGLGIVVQGRQGLKGLAEYGARVGSRLAAVDVSEVGDTVRCRLEESNEVYRLLGVETVWYEGWFALRRGRIERAVVKLEPASREGLKRGLAEFLLWLAATDPAALEKAMPDGKLKADLETGARLLELLRRWRTR